DGGFYPELQDRGRKLGLNDDVIWTGYVTPEEVTEILLAADLFLAPFDGGISSRRGSLMAAIAHGLPVVSTPPKIATRYFRAGENFAQVPFGDAVALADEVASLMDDPERRNLLREGSEVLSGVFSWSDIALRTRDFLEALLAGKRP
ncbi:MAG: glycosyltransferase, partial [Nitrospinaceae bacterium]|nr:glycosyltransferase [Nitrospinaceae bacterium]